MIPLIQSGVTDPLLAKRLQLADRIQAGVHVHLRHRQLAEGFDIHDICLLVKDAILAVNAVWVPQHRQAPSDASPALQDDYVARCIEAAVQRIGWICEPEEPR